MLQKVTECLQRGEVCALPTDTVFGLMVDGTNVQAVKRLYDTKGRGDTQPSQVLVNSIEMAKEIARVDERAERLLQRFWPGGLTLILPVNPQSKIAKQLLAGGDTVGLRWPDHALICDVITTLGVPLAASSANRKGQPTLNSAAEIASHFPHMLVYDAPCGSAQASTVAALNAKQLIIYREGAITESQLQECLKNDES